MLRRSLVALALVVIVVAVSGGAVADDRVEPTTANVETTAVEQDHAHDGSGGDGLAVLAIVLSCVGIVMSAVALMTRRTNPADGPDQAPLP